MADPARIIQRRDPLDGLSPIEVRNRLSITAAPAGGRLVLRGPASAAQKAGTAFGLALPEALNTATTDNSRAAFKLGPDEWLLTVPENGEKAAFDAIEAGVAEPHSLVDVSHRNVAIEVSGMLAADILNSGVMLDLDLKAFPVGMVTRTLYAKTEIVLWRKGESAFHIEVWRSYAPYLHGLLEQAAREYIKD